MNLTTNQRAWRDLANLESNDDEILKISIKQTDEWSACGTCGLRPDHALMKKEIDAELEANRKTYPSEPFQNKTLWIQRVSEKKKARFLRELVNHHCKHKST